ncbi:MAG: Uma2 family endonuclease [Butyrivibrio sp.]|nr:Uma2 family endonuclease [Butyrivibrio sp.]
MALAHEKLHTVDDILALPDGERAELIDGVMYDMASPSRIHQKILMALSSALHSHVKEKGGECEVYPAPFAVFLADDDRNYLEPDVVVVCDKDKLRDDGCHGAPDLVAEIVSPYSISRDYMTKLFKYKDSGVKEYWIVDPEKRNVRVYNFQTEYTDDYSFDTNVDVGLFPGLKINIDKLIT